MKAFLLVIIIFPFLTGCSVMMAAHGLNEPNLAVLQPGAPRAAVEQELTNPIQSERTRRGTRVTYQFFSNDKPSAQRAVIYGLIDIATLGLAELATSPLEAAQGNCEQVLVEYNSDDRLLSAKRITADADLPTPEALIGLKQTNEIHARVPESQPEITGQAETAVEKAPKPEAKAAKSDRRPVTLSQREKKSARPLNHTSRW